jgi:hypothetical protein
MRGVFTSKPWPPLPWPRATLHRFWFVGDHGFWVDRLRERHEWIPPWYGTSRDYKALRWRLHATDSHAEKNLTGVAR